MSSSSQREGQTNTSKPKIVNFISLIDKIFILAFLFIQGGYEG
jgi:hypothetical protein